jgi:hypothetical protein
VPWDSTLSSFISEADCLPPTLPSVLAGSRQNIIVFRLDELVEGLRPSAATKNPKGGYP